jgi:hypothetical protein
MARLATFVIAHQIVGGKLACHDGMMAIGARNSLFFYMEDMRKFDVLRGIDVREFRMGEWTHPDGNEHNNSQCQNEETISLHHWPAPFV